MFEVQQCKTRIRMQSMLIFFNTRYVQTDYEMDWIEFEKTKDKHHTHSVQSNISFIWFCYFNFDF